MLWNSTKEREHGIARVLRYAALAGLVASLLAPKAMAADADAAPGADGKYTPLTCAARITCQRAPACAMVGARMVEWGSAAKTWIGPVEVKFLGQFNNVPTVLTTANWARDNALPLVPTGQNAQDTEVVVKTSKDKFLVDSQNAACDYCVNWLAIGDGKCP